MGISKVQHNYLAAYLFHPHPNGHCRNSGAILGMERELRDGVYPEGAEPVQEFFSKDKSDIAVQIMRPVKKENIGFNLINTKIGIHIIQFQLKNTN